MLPCVESYIPYFCKADLHDMRRRPEGLGKHISRQGSGSPLWKGKGAENITFFGVINNKICKVELY
jgi:hypothetical protein